MPRPTRQRALLAVACLAATAGCERTDDDSSPAMLEVPAAAGASLPRLVADPRGQPWLSWVEPHGAGHVLRYARLEGDAWAAPATAARGTGWFVNWADFPSVLPLGDGRLAAHWLVKREGGPYAYDVHMAVSGDGGGTWSDAATPHGDGTASEHGFVTLFSRADGVGAVWLDGRYMPDDGPMTLRVGGLDFGGSPLPEAELDDMSCDCCQTAAAQGPAGLVVAFRDRTPAEIRDIYATVRTATGWTQPAPVAEDGWEMAACPVNGPAMDGDANSVAVAWFTAATGTPAVRVAFSTDGTSFEEPLDVAAGDNLGRVDIVLAGDGSAIVSWLGTGGEGAAIRYRRAWPDGRMGGVRSLATTSAARSAGFPQLELAGKRLVFAWTDDGEPGAVRSALVPLPD